MPSCTVAASVAATARAQRRESAEAREARKGSHLLAVGGSPALRLRWVVGARRRARRETRHAGNRPAGPRRRGVSCG
eukprot:3843269-Prymnesium_polylepis.1